LNSASINGEPTLSACSRSTGTSTSCDVLVVGGGINGAGIARDLAGRGLSVVLSEQDDLAAHTSSSSTKLIHGGLRYLEHYEFSLVRKSLAEREVLLASAPHIIRPLRFVMPHDPSMRPIWLVRAGLFLYDHLARREVLPGSHGVDLRTHEAGKPLRPVFSKGFVYSDGWVDDARLVVLNAVDAREHGAEVLTRSRCVDATRDGATWRVRLQSATGKTDSLTARALVNATGPWAAQFLNEHAHLPHVKALRLVKGSHIVVPKLFEHDYAYIFQNPDKRIIFAIPYERNFTLIGTTEVEHVGALAQAHIDPAEVAYLCAQVSRYFVQPVVPSDVVWSYAGIRPLLDDESSDPSALTRDYSLDLEDAEPPLLTVLGGKLTTFRKLAEEAADLLVARLGARAGRGRWTEGAHLPGGDLSAWIGESERPDTDFLRFARALVSRHPELPEALCWRWARAYGTRVALLIGEGQGSNLGAEVVSGLFEAELHYLHDFEWARTAHDVLWRRSKLGLHLTAPEREAVARWCAAHWHDAAAAERRESA
jgi:glycerol-3-phosphate dehydrogenase